MKAPARLRVHQLKQLAKRLRAAKKRLLRLAATDCRRIRERVRNERRGIARQLGTAKAAAHCATGRAVALGQFSAHFGRIVREILAIQAAAAASVSPRRRARQAELKAERRSREDADVPRELEAVWQKYRHKFKATRDAQGRIRTSAVEKFREWTEENPDVVYEAVAADADDWLQDITKAYAEQTQGDVSVYIDGKAA